MRRPSTWPYWLVVLILIVAQAYISLTQVLPYHLLRAVQHMTGGTLAVYDIQVSFPFTITDRKSTRLNSSH